MGTKPDQSNDESDSKREDVKLWCNVVRCDNKSRLW